MEEETFINKRITHKDVYQELLKQRKIQNDILEQAKKTNGRVTKLEGSSIGLWIANHPFKFTTFVVVLMSFLISDLRHPIIDFIASLFL